TPIDTYSLEKKKFELRELDFDHLSTKAKIKYSEGSKTTRATANIRMKRDSIIWFSIVPALGIEAARGMITRDSLVFMNRIDKTYSIMDYASLSEKYNFRIDYNMIQSILVGNLPLGKTDGDRIKRRQDYYIIKQNNGTLKVENYISAHTMKLNSVHITESPGKNTLDLEYSDFKMVDNEYVFPFSAFISLNYQAKDGKPLNTEINIEHNKTEING
ncbi:DUF4292 domain-containing protein, partial [Xanthovirga aplysinae]|uniref:DUF4292 domain-containing protein n=1 Tax=Xanthovirga aplysinae TaxID=2529853 RepID=UPI0012BC6424